MKGPAVHKAIYKRRPLSAGLVSDLSHKSGSKITPGRGCAEHGHPPGKS